MEDIRDLKQELTVKTSFNTEREAEQNGVELSESGEKITFTERTRLELEEMIEKLRDQLKIERERSDNLNAVEQVETEENASMENESFGNELEELRVELEQWKEATNLAEETSKLLEEDNDALREERDLLESQLREKELQIKQLEMTSRVSIDGNESESFELVSNSDEKLKELHKIREENMVLQEKVEFLSNQVKFVNSKLEEAKLLEDVVEKEKSHKQELLERYFLLTF